MDIDERDFSEGSSSYDDILDFESDISEEEYEADDFDYMDESFYRPLEEY